ncbi:MAG: AraC family ligand binding domain-containing protein [Blautia sp.]|nr:AraC family ligand binding domain-containing protein [Blautia sp.]
MDKKNGKRIGFTESEQYISLEDLQNVSTYSEMNPVNLDYYGSEQCAPGHSFGPHVRASYVLHMVQSGRGKLVKDGREYEIGAGDAFLIRPKEETIYTADREDPWHYMWIGFHGYRVSEMLDHIGFTAGEPVLHCRNMPKIRETMETLLKAKDLTYINGLIRMSALYRLMALLTENSSAPEVQVPEKTGDSVYAAMAVDLLMNSVRTQRKIADIARQIGISRNHLTMVFKREMGVSPQEFLMNYRMEKAASLLTVTTDPISVVAAEVGYSDPLAFSKAFRARYGVSPTEFRSQKPEIVILKEKGEYTSEYPL